MQPTIPWSADVDQQQLIQLAGEQLLLQKQHDTLNATDQRDRASLLSLFNTLQMEGATPTWLASGVALLTRLHETRNTLASMAQRLRELKALTGL